MSKTIFSSLSATTFLIFSVITVFGICSCNSRELLRSRAESLIKNSAEFKYPTVIGIKRANENEPLYREMSSGSETLEESKAEDLNGYWRSDVDLAVLDHLDLLSVEQTLTKEDPGMGLYIKPSRYFVTKFRANEKGQNLWKETGLDVTDESLPLAVRKFSGISGITQQGENQAVAEFAYEYAPNALGKVFDPKRDEFNSLPVELQRQIRGEIGTPPKNVTADWAGERKGKGLFQKYDDGWRLGRLIY